jgi:hypothetical protein
MAPATLAAAQKGQAERDRVVQHGADPPRDGFRVAGHPELTERRGKVEVDPLAHHPVALEREHDEPFSCISPPRDPNTSPVATIS